MERQLSEKSQEIERLQEQREGIQQELSAVRRHRRLLFETGHQLEQAVLEALGLLGFDAQPFAEGTSEFDAVFCCDEGRFLGEVEGKDKGAIAVGKLDQLDRNIREDFERDEVDEYARGVLFGNASRLTPPEERDQDFTDKCIEAARRSGAALVRTPDLFPIVRYLLSHEDPEFARQCRECILGTSGEVVVFPDVPESETDAVGEGETQ